MSDATPPPVDYPVNPPQPTQSELDGVITVRNSITDETRKAIKFVGNNAEQVAAFMAETAPAAAESFLEKLMDNSSTIQNGEFVVRNDNGGYFSIGAWSFSVMYDEVVAGA